MLDEGKLRRLRKVLAHARQGVDGEKTTAEHQLKSLLTKYGMTMADLESSEQNTRLYEFKYSSELERRLLRQICAVALDVHEVAYYTRSGSRSRLEFELTPAQNAEIVMTYAVMKGALEKELEIAFRAFVHANGLFPPTPSAEKQGVATAEDLQVLRMASFISKTPVLKAITAEEVDVDCHAQNS